MSLVPATGPVKLRTPCDDSVWEKYKNKGILLLDMMYQDDGPAGAMFDPPRLSAQSDFNEFPTELQRWGYLTERETPCCIDDTRYGMATTMQSLGISHEISKWTKLTTSHGNWYSVTQIKDQRYVADGQTYRVIISTIGRLLLD